MLKKWEPCLKLLEDQIIASLGNYLKEQGVSEDEIAGLAENLALPTDEASFGGGFDRLALEGLRRLQQAAGYEAMEKASMVFSPTSGFLADPEEGRKD